jgi:hypothetical protein
MENNDFCRTLKKAGYHIFEESFRTISDASYVMVMKDGIHSLAVCGDDSFHGETANVGTLSLKLCPLTHENLMVLQKLFPYTVPSSPAGHNVSIGTGDRLGICTVAHLKAFEGTGVFPVLAQQSKRELNLTGRTYQSVLDDVAWQVFEAGYEGGYAADGDHLKTMEEVSAALADGAKMITLDCSGSIDNNAYKMTEEEAAEACRNTFDKEILSQWLQEYNGKKFQISDDEYISFGGNDFFRMLLTYGKSLDFIEQVYRSCIAVCGKSVAFEISIDETDVDTTPAAHYFVASELISRGVRIDSVAPRFCGEFQKGIDYIGELDRFESEFSTHAAIAVHFNYKISVHSGSDKFSVFPYIGRLSNGRFHLKTAGTSWVEAVRVIAMCAPNLFRRMVHFSLEHYEEARLYYHVMADAAKVPEVDEIKDNSLAALMSETNTRQVMHITYGLLLQEKKDDGTYVFRDDIYRVLKENREILVQTIANHIRRHLISLGVA